MHLVHIINKLPPHTVNPDPTSVEAGGRYAFDFVATASKPVEP
jgi:hypothetical protein